MVLISYGLVSINFTHILQDYLSSNGATIKLLGAREAAMANMRKLITYIQQELLI